MQPILGKIFELILTNYKDVDLRDRVYYYYNLMKKDIKLAEYIICGEQNVVDYYYSEFDDEYIDQIFSEFNSLSIVYRKPEEKFVKYIPDDIQEDEDKNDEEEQIEDKPLPNNNDNSSNQQEINNFSNNEQEIIHKLGNINEDSLKEDYSIDENTYQNLWGQYQSYVIKNYRMIGDEVEISGYVDYLKSKNIFTKAYGTNNGVSTLFLFSCEKNYDIIFITKLILDSNNRKIEYELKCPAQEYANNYNNYLYENVSPLIDQDN